MTLTIENIRSNACAGDPASIFKLALLHLNFEGETDVEICERPNDFRPCVSMGMNLLKKAALLDNKEACEQLGKVLLEPETYFPRTRITDLNREQMHHAAIYLLNRVASLADNTAEQEVAEIASAPKSLLARIFSVFSKPSVTYPRINEQNWQNINHATDMLVTTIGYAETENSMRLPQRAVA